MRTVKYSQLPPSIIERGNTYHYNYSVTEETPPPRLSPSLKVQRKIKVRKAEKVWVCESITLSGKPSSNAIFKALVEERWGNGIEQKLINDYNAYQLRLIEDESARTKYLTFLTERLALKKKVEDDFNSYLASLNK